jgi:hypothetical protein
MQFPRQGSSTSQCVIIGAAFAGREDVVRAVAGLVALGVPKDALHAGAREQHVADELARVADIAADVQAEDPLGRFATLGNEGRARSAADRGGVIGALVGALAGFLISLTPARGMVPVAAPLQGLGDVLLFFVVGLFVGTTLGSALAPQPTSHAAFRLIDAVSEGALVLVVTAPSGRAEEIRAVMQAHGGRYVTSVPA